MRKLAFIFFVALSRWSFAHDPGLSSANLRLGERQISVVLTYNERDIATVLGEPAASLREQAPGVQDKLIALAGRALDLKLDGVVAVPEHLSARLDQKQNVELDLDYRRPVALHEILLRSTLLAQMPFGHRQAFAGYDSLGREIARGLLSNHEDVAKIVPTELRAPAGQPFLDFFLLGVRHILTGYDHLLFLFGLLIVCRAPRSALLLITCFTLAHSLTLALSTFGLVNLPSRFVEATIAASIVYVGVENLLRRDGMLRGRWLLTFVFGLIHGLGFASVLHEMGIAKTGLNAVVPLVAFNSGVEVGQLSVAALVLPIIWQIRRRPAFLRVGIPACSAFVALAGAYWLFERTLLG